MNIVGVYVLAIVILHLLFSFYIYKDTCQRQKLNYAVLFFPAQMWVFAALIMGLWIVAFYWVCHYSEFFKKES